MIFFICFGYVFSRLQAPLQAFLRPALWFPGLRAIHQKKEKWNLLGDTSSNYTKILDGLTDMKDWSSELYGDHEMTIYKVDNERMFIQLHFLTPLCQWLDVVEIEVKPGQYSGTEVLAHSFSTGLFPVCLPLAVFVNMILFFIPFYDWGQNHKRLETIRHYAKISNDVEYLSNC